jgi:hypothetical protein
MADRSGQAEWAVMMKALGPLHCDAALLNLVKRMKATDPHQTAVCATR